MYKREEVVDGAAFEMLDPRLIVVLTQNNPVMRMGVICCHYSGLLRQEKTSWYKEN